MAHHYKIKIVPHQNKDGTVSKSKKDYVVFDRTRGKKIFLGVSPSRKLAEEMINKARDAAIDRHVKKHPNDKAFKSSANRGRKK